MPEILVFGDLEMGGSESQGHPWLHHQFKVSLGYRRTWLKKHKEAWACRDGGVSNKIDILLIFWEIYTYVMYFGYIQPHSSSLTPPISYPHHSPTHPNL